MLFSNLSSASIEKKKKGENEQESEAKNSQHRS